MLPGVVVGAIAGFLAGMLGAAGAILLYGWIELDGGGSGRDHETLFSFAILGLYLIALVIGALTLAVTLLGRPIFARVAREEVEKHVEERERKIGDAILQYEREALASSFFVAGYVLGELGTTSAGFYRSSTSWSQKAIDQLPEIHPGKMTAKNNFAYYGSFNPAPDDVDKIIDYARELRQDFPKSLNVEHAKTYAAVTLNLYDLRPEVRVWLRDALLILETALQCNGISDADAARLREYIRRLNELQETSNQVASA